MIEAPHKAPPKTRPKRVEAIAASPGELPNGDAPVPPELAPRLAAGVQLLGEYKGSGYKEPPYLARRGDGQTIQMPRLLFLVAESVDGRADHAEIARRVSEKFGRRVSADNIRVLVADKLRPLGVLAQADGSSPALAKVAPLLGLRLRAVLLPERTVRAVTTLFKPFFHPPVAALVLAGLAAVDVWFFLFHGVAGPMRELAYNPVLLLMVLGLVVVATALHEIGHATAARYGGAEPGVMGAGIYVIWPAFYTDVTDAYRLDRKGRLRTDLGGVYFNGLFVLAVAGAYFATGFEPLLVLVLVQHMQVLQQFLPFLRLDGYYVLSDLTGVPDLFAWIKPTLRSLVPGQREDKRAGQLKPWVRVVVTAWVVALVPIFLVLFGLMVFNAPRVVATAWDSFVVHVDEASSRFGGGNVLGGFVSTAQTATLVLPALGIVVALGRGGKRMLAAAWHWSDGAADRRAFVAAATAGLVALTAFVWWPNGEYKPIQPGEKGTLSGALSQLGELDTGRPGLTPAREKELGGAPFASESGARKVDSPARRSSVTDEEDREASTGGSTQKPETGTPGESSAGEAAKGEAAKGEAATGETPTTETQPTETAPSPSPPSPTAPSDGQPAAGEEQTPTKGPAGKPPDPGLTEQETPAGKTPPAQAPPQEPPKPKQPKEGKADAEPPPETTPTETTPTETTPTETTPTETPTETTTPP